MTARRVLAADLGATRARVALFVAESEEGQIWIEPQGICVMAGIGLRDGRATRALASVRERLATPLKRDYRVLRAASGEAAPERGTPKRDAPEGTPPGGDQPLSLDAAVIVSMKHEAVDSDRAGRGRSTGFRDRCGS